MEDMKNVGFISQDIIEELFEKYTCVSLNDACETLNTTFKDFIDEHFSTLFKNCYPHGLARLTVVDKPVHNNFDSFGALPSCSTSSC
uniref:Uncharacterized protein n=1 Tax=Panagrolaimus sp. ES5 TaxID=591445 RepID=A0AC34FZX2_9BILA